MRCLHWMLIRVAFWFFFLFYALPVWAVDYTIGIEIEGAYTDQKNFLNRDDWARLDYFHFSESTYHLQWRATPHISLALKEGIEAFFQTDILFVDTDETDVDEGLNTEPTNAFLNLSNKKVSANIGLQAILLGQGRIMADNVPAAIFEYQPSKYYIQMTLAQVLGGSPMVGAAIGYKPDIFEYLEFFALWFQDKDNAFAEALPLIYQIWLDPESEADVYWIGGSTDLFVGDALFSAVGAYQWGEISFSGNHFTSNTKLDSFMIDLALEGNISEWCSLGAFFFVAGGDDTPLRGDLNSFVAIMPYNPRAAIFFNPEFLDLQVDDERLTFNGGFYGGVLAPGLTLTLAPVADLSMEATLTTLYAQEPLSDGSEWYGWEFDLEFDYTLNDNYSLYLAAAQFTHGDYYKSLLEESTDPATLFTIGLRASF